MNVNGHNLTHDRLALRALGVLMLTLGLACGDTHLVENDAGTDAGGATDGGPSADGGPGVDAGPGEDAGPVDAGGPVEDGGTTMPSCDADDAQHILCPEFLCDGLPTWHWNGDECFAIDCGACTGDDCDRTFLSREACESAHDGCDASLCRATGGTWRFWAEDCGYRCGFEAPIDCLVGGPSCDCGVGQNFVPGVGCETDPSCPIFEMPIPSELCEGTGGEWGNFCEDSVCGVRSAAECLAEACHCPGETQIFDEVRGCVDGEVCFRPAIDAPCIPDRSRCPGAAICCENCGGAGCFGAQCELPTCDDDPDTDICGNNLLAP